MSAGTDRPIDDAQVVRLQLTAAAGMAGLGRFAVTLPGGRIDADDVARRIVGLAAADGAPGLGELVGRIHPDDRSDVFESIAAPLESGGPFGFRCRAYRQHDSEGVEPRRLAVSGHVERRPGSVLVAGVLVDDTPMLQAQERHAHARKTDALDAMAAGIAHDLNNLVSAILGNASHARRLAAPGDDIAETLEEIERAATRAGEVLRRLLSFGTREPRAAAGFALGRVAEEACALLRPLLGDSVTLRLRTAPEAPTVVGDATQFHQTVINLVTNAAHALGPQGGVIDVIVDAVPAPGPHPATAPEIPCARLRVRDDGAGIPDAILARVFDPFFTTKAADGGTGLGLAAVSSIVDAHGGRLTVDSVLGRGTTFTIVLPPGTGPAVPADPASVAGADIVRVLYVSPQPALVRFAERSMPSHGCIPAAYADPREAIAALSGAPQAFDVLVTDTTPAIDPASLIRSVRAIRPDLPVILHVAPIGPVTSARAEALGADAWVPQPSPPSQLCAEVLRLAASRPV